MAHPTTSWRGRADEGCYLRYATRIAAQGPGAFPALFREYLDDPLAPQLFPSPIRLTRSVPDSLSVLFSGPDFASLADVSLLAFLALLVLVFAALRRTQGEPTALAVTLLLSVSPLHLAMARRALADNLNATLLLTCLGLCLHGLTTHKTSRRCWAGVGVAYLFPSPGRARTLFSTPSPWARTAGPVVLPHHPTRLWPVACISLLPLLAAAGLAALAAGGPGTAWAVFSATTRQPAHN